MASVPEVFGGLPLQNDILQYFCFVGELDKNGPSNLVSLARIRAEYWGPGPANCHFVSHLLLSRQN